MQINKTVPVDIVDTDCHYFPIAGMTELGPNAKIIIAHHSIGALMVGNRTLNPRGF